MVKGNGALRLQCVQQGWQGQYAFRCCPQSGFWAWTRQWRTANCPSCNATTPDWPGLGGTSGKDAVEVLWPKGGRREAAPATPPGQPAAVPKPKLPAAGAIPPEIAAAARKLQAFLRDFGQADYLAAGLGKLLPSEEAEQAITPARLQGAAAKAKKAGATKAALK